ncbi:MAG: hypothetical protein AAGD06_25675 [Acidobacteriota bacterium]
MHSILRHLRPALAVPALLVSLAAPAAATVYVISDTRDVVAVDLSCTLREALTAAVDQVAVDTCPAGTASNTIELGFGTYEFDQGPFLIPNSIAAVDLEITGINGLVVGTRVDLGGANAFLNVSGIGIGTEIPHRLRIAGVQIQDAGGNGRAAVQLSGSGALTLDNVSFVGNACVSNCALAASAVGFSGSGDLAIRDSFFRRNEGLTSLFLRPDGDATVRIERTRMLENPGGLQIRAVDTADVVLEDLDIEQAGVDGDASLVLFLDLRDQVTAAARRVALRDNIVTTGTPASFSLTVDAALTLERWNLERNQSPSSGALAMSATGQATVTVRDLVALRNTSASGTSAFEGAVRITTVGDATLDWQRGELRDNVTASGGFQPTAGLSVVGRDGGEILVDRVKLLANRHVNTMDQPGALQATVIADGVGSRATVRNSLVADAPGIGMRLSALDDGIAELVNATFTGNDSTVIFVAGEDPVAAPSRVQNSIFFGNDDDALDLMGMAILAEANLVGVDPLFMDAGAGDYRLLPGSPAIDGGFFASGQFLGPLDLGGRPRIAPGTAGGTPVPDIGAHEFQVDLLFDDGFESGDLLRWSSSTP